MQSRRLREDDAREPLCGAVKRRQRNHLLDLLRIVFATAVIFAHAPEIVDGNRSRDPFSRLTGSGMSLGDAAVDAFFLLSGFLIVQSWEAEPKLSSFLRKRVLRIVPGFLVACIVSTLLVGVLAPGVPDFFLKFDRLWVKSVLALGEPITPPVLPGQRFPSVDVPLWTIAYEFRCYLLVALLGAARLLSRRTWLALTVTIFTIQAVPFLERMFTWTRFLLVTGTPDRDFRLFLAFCIGGCFYLFRKEIPFRPVWAGAALAALVISDLLRPEHFQSPFLLFGGYLLFYAARLRPASLEWMNKVPDLSYGIYLYGWPLEALLIWYIHGSAWLAATLATLLCVPIAWMSWRLVERPMIRLGHRGLRPSPATSP